MLGTQKNKTKEKDREPNSFISRVGTGRRIQTIWSKDLSQSQLHVSAAHRQPDICPWDSQLWNPNQDGFKTFSKEIELLFAIRVSFFYGFILKTCVGVTPGSKTTQVDFTLSIQNSFSMSSSVGRVLCLSLRTLLCHLTLSRREKIIN